MLMGAVPQQMDSLTESLLKCYGSSLPPHRNEDNFSINIIKSQYDKRSGGRYRIRTYHLYNVNVAL